MARVREFDTDEVVQKSMEVFWRKGFEATTIQDLSEKTGLGRGSLYAAFESKHGLYERALRRYVRQTTDATRKALLHQVPLRQVIRDLLLARVEETLAEPERPGCLLVMAITELVPHDEKTREIVGDAVKALQDSLAATLHMARSLGELPAETDIPALADFFVTLIQGLRIVGTACPDQVMLTRVVDTALSTIPES